jgi:ATP-dependent DNA helicase RecG
VAFIEANAIARTIEALRAEGTDSRTVEAKSAAGGLPKTLASSLCAFANLPGGGTIILGLDESAGFSVVELLDPRALADGLISMARQALEPPVQAVAEVITFEGLPIVVAVIAEIPTSAKPCRLASTRKAYLRFGDGDYELSAVEEEAFVVSRGRPNFDEQPVDGALSQDLDDELVAAFLAQARLSSTRLRAFEDTDVLMKTGVQNRTGVPTIAGIIALGQYPQQFLPAVSIRAALLPVGNSRGQVRALDEATFTGPVTVMLDEAMEWVRKNSRTEIVEDQRTGAVSNRLWPPALAVRELIANAIVHRDLAPWSSGRAIEIRMSSKAFRITSPGGLYGVTVASLVTTELTSARNRQLVDICKRLQTKDGRVVEALATGIPTVLEEIAAAQLPAPGFFDNGLSFTAIIYARPDHQTSTAARDPEVVGARTTSRDASHAGKASQTDQARADASGKVTPALKMVLDVLAASGPQNLNLLTERLQIPKASVSKRLQKLMQQGRVTSDGGRGITSNYQLGPY